MSKKSIVRVALLCVTGAVLVTAIRLLACAPPEPGTPRLAVSVSGCSETLYSNTPPLASGGAVCKGASVTVSASLNCNPPDASITITATGAPLTSSPQTVTVDGTSASLGLDTSAKGTISISVSATGTDVNGHAFSFADSTSITVFQMNAVTPTSAVICKNGSAGFSATTDPTGYESKIAWEATNGTFSPSTGASVTWTPQTDFVSTTVDDVTITAKCGCGSSEVTATATVYQVSSVSAVKSEIAAGALASAPHQTEVDVQLSPAGAWPAAVWLTGGGGHAVGSPEWYDGHQLIIEGPAKIQGGGGCFVAGGTTPSTAAIVVTADATGKAVLTLTSSNQAEQTCTVLAKSGTDTTRTASEASSEVVFRKGSQTVSFPDYFGLGTTVTATVTRTFDGVPLEGHDTVIYVASVIVGNDTKPFDYIHPAALDTYAQIVSGDERNSTDASGHVSARVMIKDVEDLKQVIIETRDLQVFEP